MKALVEKLFIRNRVGIVYVKRADADEKARRRAGTGRSGGGVRHAAVLIRRAGRVAAAAGARDRHAAHDRERHRAEAQRKTRRHEVVRQLILLRLEESTRTIEPCAIWSDCAGYLSKQLVDERNRGDPNDAADWNNDRCAFQPLERPLLILRRRLDIV